MPTYKFLRKKTAYKVKFCLTRKVAAKGPPTGLSWNENL